jgi:hypothetical protein
MLKSERINKAALNSALHSFVSAVGTDERSFVARQGTSEYDRLLDAPLKLDELKRAKNDRDGDEAHEEQIRQMTKPMISSNLMLMHPLKILSCQFLVLGLLAYFAVFELGFLTVSPE